MKVLEKGIMTTNIHIGFGSVRPIIMTNEPYHHHDWNLPGPTWPRPGDDDEDGFGDGDFDY